MRTRFCSVQPVDSSFSVPDRVTLPEERLGERPEVFEQHVPYDDRASHAQILTWIAHKVDHRRVPAFIATAKPLDSVHGRTCGVV